MKKDSHEEKPKTVELVKSTYQPTERELKDGMTATGHWSLGTSRFPVMC